MDNPRFPHTLTINRPKKENGATVFDENGNYIKYTASETPVNGYDG